MIKALVGEIDAEDPIALRCTLKMLFTLVCSLEHNLKNCVKEFYEIVNNTFFSVATRCNF